MIDRLLAAARAGSSGTLVIHGEAGIGKSALLDYAAEHAAGMRVLRASGVETEAELPFAALHMLLRPVLDRVDALPDPQRAALRRAFGLDTDGGDDPFLAGLAVLNLLTDLAEEQPLLCLVDDAQWLDSASVQALLFAAGRLDADPVVMIGAAREYVRTFPVPHPDGLLVEGLDPADARALLEQRAPGLRAALRTRVLREAAGNPLALIELAATARDAGEVVAAVGLEPLPAAERVQELFARQLRELGDAARRLLLIAAAEESGNLELVSAAARGLGVEPATLAEAERARLVTVTAGRVEFRHPLLRSAAYHSAPLASRHAVHRAIGAALADAAVADAGGAAADRRAWHLAVAAAGRDELVAAGLEAAAERARLRGGYAAVAAAYERAATLTPDPLARARRLLAAASAANDAGHLRRAEQLADQIDELSADDLLRARVCLLRATMPTAAGASRRSELPAAAARIADRAPRLAAAMLAQAGHLAWTVYDHRLAVKVAAELRDLIPAAEAETYAFAEAVSHQALVVAGDPAADRRVVARYLAAVRRDPANASTGERLIAAVIALWRLDYACAWDIATALVADCRARGMIGWLPSALYCQAAAQHLRGEWANGEATALEGLRLAIDTGQRPRAAILASLISAIAAFAGDSDRFTTWAERAAELASPDSSAVTTLWYHTGQMHLDLAGGRFAAARDHMAHIAKWLGRGGAFMYQAFGVEAAVRTGDIAVARQEAAEFETWAELAGDRSARAIARRCRALAGAGHEGAYHDGDDDTVDAHYREAIRLHEGDGQPYEQARTHLLYGEWLRRIRRRSDARAQLTTALAIFEELGAAAWAERTRAELAVAGEQPHQGPAPARQPGVLASLTAQELQVTRLAAQGLSNRDIAAQLFLSSRTVGYHLYKAYPKLGVCSRGELAALFGGQRQADRTIS